ncbi:MAG: hypothetical protein JWM37_717 [Candidatus Saccharibacteria bacterium]|nr:hypothetical protein [Candidatus Saccharibacteria bacterium]
MYTVCKMSHRLPADYQVDFQKLEHSLATASEGDLHKAIVNTPFTETVQMALLRLGITVLLLVNEENQTLDRIALSDTEMAKGSTRYSMKRFNDIRIPMSSPENILVKAVRTGEPEFVSDWSHMFVPELTPSQARLNQASAGIGTSAIYPFRNGAMIFSFFSEPGAITDAHRDFMRRYIDLVTKYLS